ncbi:TNF receptor-associated factor 6-like [Anthonomus grandis grandis]|uniref:TNF receptor-associated factor 6-like n=1 Tax=Anthonomus grandis grandis TaxID=2921223 RepID=UPI00216569EE|nr:TNF receptor-associated factor 6-like [Anthonomus grandis grandis]
MASAAGNHQESHPKKGLAKESSIGVSEYTSPEVAQESSIDEFAAPEARFECPICLAWLRDPVLTSCGHRFCRNCIQEWLQKENACPVDNMRLNRDKDIFPDNFTRREISQQRTKCPNFLRGCLEELSPLDIDSHLLVCEFRPPELPDHEKLCCQYINVGCKQKFEDEPELQKHLDENIQLHLMLLSQAYSKVNLGGNGDSAGSALAQANFWDPPSKQESSSQQQSPDENLQNLLKALYERIVFLEQKTREQDIIIANMSQQISNYNSTLASFQQRYCNGCFVWHFHDFKNKIRAMKENTNILHYSPGFYTSSYGYKMCIRINLSPKDPNYLAILVHIMKSEHDQALDWPFCGRLSITIVHPTHSYKNIKETMMSRPELQSFNRPIHDLNPKGFGYTEFALLEELFDQEYTVNNQLIIKVNAQPV